MYETWIARVDEVLERRVYMTHLDMPDTDTRGMFEEGLTPSQAASEIIRFAGDILGIWQTGTYA